MVMIVMEVGFENVMALVEEEGDTKSQSEG